MVTNDERSAFSDRLNRVLDDARLPPKGSGRQGQLAKDWGLSQKGVRKWLEGEAIPETTRLIEMAKRYEVSFEWLASGRHPVTLLPSEKIVRALPGFEAETLATRTNPVDNRGAGFSELYAAAVAAGSLSPSAIALIKAVAAADQKGTPTGVLDGILQLLKAIEPPAAGVNDYPGLRP